MIQEITSNSIHFKKEDGSNILFVRQRIDKDKNICIIYLEGEVTNEVSSALADELCAILSVGIGIIIDMEKVGFLSLGFMEDLIQLEHKAESGQFDSMLIRNVSKSLFDDIRKAGFSNSLDIELQEGAL